MPELLIPIFVFYLLYLYFTMKKTTTPIEKPVLQSTIEQPVVADAADVKPKKVTVNPKTPSKPKAVTPKPVPKAETAPSVADAPKKPTVPKSSQGPKASKKAPVAASAQVAKPAELTVSERVGLTAGSLWRYLSENGASSVAKLLRDLPEDEKIIQRSIGWLAHEGKITLVTNNRVETIGLAG